MENSGYHKRRREAEKDSSPSDEVSLSEAKRLRADDFFDILSEEYDAGEQDLASVMRSLEEEIGIPSSPPFEQLAAPTSAEEQVVLVLEQPDLEYLFEASDDDLGLPPTASSTSDDGGELEVDEEAPETLEKGQEFGQIWSFDDEIHDFVEFELDALPKGRTEAAAAAEVATVFDGDLFDYPDVLCGLSDVTEFSWRSESSPAV